MAKPKKSAARSKPNETPAKEMHWFVKAILSGLTIAVIAMVIKETVYPASKPSPTTSISTNRFDGPTAITTGTGAPAIAIGSPGSNSQVAVQPGNGNSVTQVGGNLTINKGLTEETIKRLQAGMLALYEQQKNHLKATFDHGYILFTATERNQVVPFNSPMDKTLKIDWSAGYEIILTTNLIEFTIGRMTAIHSSGETKYENMTFGLDREIGFCEHLFPVGTNFMGATVLASEPESVIIAMGMHSPSH